MKGKTSCKYYVTKEQHRESHKRLHDNFGMLVADFIIHHDNKRIGNTTVMELMEWSHSQTINPTPTPGMQHDEEKQ